MINIFFLIPLMLILTSRKNRIVLFVYALFFGVIGFFFTPHINGDYTRIISRIDYSNPKMIITQPDLFLPIMIYIISFFKLSKRLVGLISASILYYFTLKSLFLATKNLKNKNILMVIIFLLCIPIILYTGVRFSTGLSFFIYGIVTFFFKKNKIKSLIFLFFSILSHFCFYYPVMIFLIYLKISKLKQMKIFLFFSIILGFLMIPEILLNVAYFLNNFFNINLISEIYITGEWGNGYLVNKSLISKCVYYLNRVCEVFIILYYTYYLEYINNKKLKDFICLISGPLYFLLFFYSEASGRYFLIILLLIVIETLNINIFIKKLNRIKLLYLFILFYTNLRLIIDIYLQYKSFIISYYNFFNINFLNIILNLKN